MRVLAVSLIGFFLTFNVGCSSDNSTNPENDNVDNSNQWLINSNVIFDGGPGKDGIPALENPTMIDVAQASYLNDDDLVIGIKFGSEIKAYPHPILDWHEIINDEIGDKKVSITYCPLTGTGIAWDRILNGNETTFGVSGLLFDNNLIPYDRASDSNWSQMKLLCVNGPNIGLEPNLYPVLETTWATWKRLYPNTRVVSNINQPSRPYETYPYGDYRSNHQNVLFPIINDDNRLVRKERVLGVIIGDKTIVYRRNTLPGEVSVLNTSFNGVNLVVIGGLLNNFMVVFDRTTDDGKTLTLLPVLESFPIVAKDDEGNTWDLFGEAIEGPRKGQRLQQPKSYMAYWFAFASFWPNTEIFGSN